MDELDFFKSKDPAFANIFFMMLVSGAIPCEVYKGRMIGDHEYTTALLVTEKLLIKFSITHHQRAFSTFFDKSIILQTVIGVYKRKVYDKKIENIAGLYPFFQGSPSKWIGRSNMIEFDIDTFFAFFCFKNKKLHFNRNYVKKKLFQLMKQFPITQIGKTL